MSDGFASQRGGVAGIVEREQRAGVSHRQPAIVQHGEHGGGELEEAQRVGDRRAVAPDGVGDVLLREIEFRDQALVPSGLVHGRQVVPLQILDERERQHRAVVHLALDRGNPLPAERLAGAQPPLARDQFVTTVAPGDRAHDDGLEETSLADRGLELLERRGIDVLARLERVGPNLADGQLDETALALGLVARRAEQRFETPAEATASCGDFGHAGTSGSGSAAGRAGESACSTRRISSCATAR